MGGEGGGNAVDAVVNDLVENGEDGDGEPELGEVVRSIASRSTRRTSTC
jgi:hypothetical protein